MSGHHVQKKNNQGRAVVYLSVVDSGGKCARRAIKTNATDAFIYNLDVGRLLAVHLQPGFPVTNSHTTWRYPVSNPDL